MFSPNVRKNLLRLTFIYRRFKDCSNSNRQRNWNDILALANIKPLELDKIWIAWEYLVTLACEKIYPECLYQAANVVDSSRPDIVVESEKLIIDAVTSNYKSKHKVKQFKKAMKAGYRVEHWCLYKVPGEGIVDDNLTYVFLEEIIEKLARIKEVQLAQDMQNLLDKHEAYLKEGIEYQKTYIATKLKELYNLLGRAPKTDELKLLKGCPSIAQIKRCFPHYNDALEYAGIVINRKKIAPYNEEIAVQELLNLVKKLGRIPTYKEVDRANLTYTTKVYRKHFGGVNACLKQQGIDVEALIEFEKNKKIRELTNTIKEFYLKHNRMPKAKDYREDKTIPSHNWVLKYYGSMSDLEKVVIEIILGEERLD